MAVTRASKIISLTDYNTGASFRVSTNKIIYYKVTLSTHAQIRYISNKGTFMTRTVSESVSTIHTATQSNTLYATQAITLVNTKGFPDGTVLYVNCDRVIYLDLLDSTYMLTYDIGSEKGLPAQLLEFSTPTAADFNTAAGNTFAVTTQPTSNVPSQTRYINNLLIGSIVGEDIISAPEITFTTKVKTGSGVVTTVGSGYTNPTVAITGGGGASATGTVSTKVVSAAPAAAGTGYDIADTITLTGGTASPYGILAVATTKPVSLATNAAGAGYVPNDTILTAGGTASTHATLTVTHTKVVSATVADPGDGLATPGVITVTGTTGTGTKFQASVTIDGAGLMSAVNSITVAGDYTANPTDIANEPVTGGDLTDGKLNVVMGVLTASITTPGSYTVQNTAFTQNTTSGAGTGATFNSVLYGVLTATVNTAGIYSAVPANPVAQGSTSGGGTGATFTSSFGIGTFTITAAGTGYTSYPVFGITDPTGTLGVITASMTVESPMTIVDGGEGINTAPTLTFSATAGTLATATATLDAALQTVTSTTLTNPGSYQKGTDTYPTLAISGGLGSVIAYDSKKSAYDLIQVEETVSTVASAVNAL